MMYGTVRQKTIKQPIPCRGIGLHSGRQISMTLRPAAADTGIVFLRTDVAAAGQQDPIIPALWNRVVDTQLCTVIANEDGVSVGTIEHLMAALAGCEIDNIVVDVDGAELPVMDGSSDPFILLIESAGVVEQDAARRAIEIRSAMQSGDDVRGVTFDRGPICSIDFEIDFESSVIGRQRRRLELVGDAFKQDVSKARTFGFLSDTEKLRSMGLALGGSLDNAVVIDEDRVLNEGGLRFKDEFVRHKILDCVGDLYLAGAPIIGDITALRSGHMANNQALHALFADPSAYRMVEMTSDMISYPAEMRATA
jgi:UDP-3-O-[3-hydroxymyristoyl] N-acetylglucosamine deacetylase